MKTVFIETFGCSANRNDSEIMAGLLERAGFIVLIKPDNADITIVNTCVVKGPTENKMKRILTERHKNGLGKRTIVTGCMPEVASDEIEAIIPDASIVGTHNIPRIIEALRSISLGKRKILIGPGDIEKVGLPRVLTNPVVGIIQINEGCIGGCAFCLTKKAKPHLRSYSEDRILKAAEQELKAGCKEIWLTSQDTAAYGFERSRKSELPGLLNKLSALPGRFKIRVGMMNPDNVLPVLDELIKAYDSDKVFKFIHIPVQAGSDRVIKLMGRPYTSSDFIHIVERFRESHPDITIATDVICGFPTETNEEFNETLELMRKLDISVINISRYSDRPGTRAEKMEKLPLEVLKKRSQKLTLLQEEIGLKVNARLVGVVSEVLLDEKGKEGSTLGRDENYKQFVLKGKYDIGKRKKTKGVKAHPHYVEASLDIE